MAKFTETELTDIIAEAISDKKGTSLTEIVIPDLVTEIGEFAFFGCSGLKKVTLLGSVKKIKNILSECENLEIINVPAKKSDFYKRRFPESLHDKIVEMPPVKKPKKQ